MRRAVRAQGRDRPDERILQELPLLLGELGHRSPFSWVLLAVNNVDGGVALPIREASTSSGSVPILL
jgi:hypothetical protein